MRDVGYQHYENYDAIEVPFTDAIPSDYKGMMGVPISFLDKYCLEQFEILGHMDSHGKVPKGIPDADEGKCGAVGWLGDGRTFAPSKCIL